MAGHTRRQALYFPTEMLSELQAQSVRQDRSISWLIAQAWKIAAAELHRVPGTDAYLAPGHAHAHAHAHEDRRPPPAALTAHHSSDKLPL